MKRRRFYIRNCCFKRGKFRICNEKVYVDSRFARNLCNKHGKIGKRR